MQATWIDGRQRPRIHKPGFWFSSGCPEKNAPQFLLNFADYKDAKRHDSLERWDP